MIRSKIIKIGNSRGIRLPAALLQQADLSGDVEITVQDGKIIIRDASRSRKDWERAFRNMAASGDDALLETGEIVSDWDREEWTWE